AGCRSGSGPSRTGPHSTGRASGGLRGWRSRAGLLLPLLPLRALHPAAGDLPVTSGRLAAAVAVPATGAVRTAAADHARHTGLLQLKAGQGRMSAMRTVALSACGLAAARAVATAVSTK